MLVAGRTVWHVSLGSCVCRLGVVLGVVFVSDTRFSSDAYQGFEYMAIYRTQVHKTFSIQKSAGDIYKYLLPPFQKISHFRI